MQHREQTSSQENKKYVLASHSASTINKYFTLLIGCQIKSSNYFKKKNITLKVIHTHNAIKIVIKVM